VDVAAAGGDALGQLGDDAHGVLAVSIRSRSAEEEEAAAARDGAAGTGMEGGEEGRGTVSTAYGALEEVDAEEVAGGHGRGERPPHQGQHLPMSRSIFSIYLSFPAARMDGWMGCPSAGGAEQMEMSRRCQPIPISS